MELRLKRLLVPAAVAICLAGCGKEGGEETPKPSPTQVSPSQEVSQTPVPTPTVAPTESGGWRTGNKVSDAYVDPDAVPTIDPASIKAKGFEYDYNALTYELVWSDEFDYEGAPDEEKWGYDVGGSGWGLFRAARATGCTESLKSVRSCRRAGGHGLLSGCCRRTGLTGTGRLPGRLILWNMSATTRI